MKELIKRYLFLILIILVTGFKIPEPVGYVNDYAGILDRETKVKLNYICESLTKNNIAEYAIVIVNTIEDATDFDYAQSLFDKWKIGKKGLDNGVLLLVALKEKRVRIHTGYGIESVITDGIAGEIIDKYIIPYFKMGKFNEGILNGSMAIVKVIDKNGVIKDIGMPKRIVRKNQDMKGSFIIFVIAFIIIFNIILLRFSRRDRYHGGRYYGGFGGFGGFGGGGFGGFGGGESGGGGASRGW